MKDSSRSSSVKDYRKILRWDYYLVIIYLCHGKVIQLERKTIYFSVSPKLSPQLLRNSLLYLICRKRNLSLKTNFELSISRWSLKEDLQ